MSIGHWKPLAVIALMGLVVFAACAPAAGIDQSPQKPSSVAAAPNKPAVNKWEDLVAAAQREGTLTYYVEGGSETRTALSQAFYKKYGISVEMVVGKGAEIVAKIKGERQAGIYLADAITTGGTSATDLKKVGVLEPLDAYLISPDISGAGIWPEGGPKFADKEHTVVWLGYYYMPYVIINTDMVKKDEIKSHMDLLEPKWKGKITLFDPTVAGTSLYWVIYLQRMMGEQWADKFFREFVKQDLVMTRDNRLHIESVARGKYPVGVGYSMSASGDLIKMGAPILPVPTVEGGQVNSGSGIVSLVAGAPHPNAARVFVNWLLSQEGMKVWAEASGYIPVRRDITPTWVNPSLVPPQGGKILWIDEEFTQFLSDKGRDVTKKYFGELTK